MLEPIKNESSSVDIIIRKFYRSSLDYDLGPDEMLQMTWSRQEEFLNATVKSQLMQKFPAKSQFIKLFFKKLILRLEKKQEVHDDLYNFLCLAMNCNDTEDYCYRHYVIGNNIRNVVTLRETNKMVVNGTTGMRTWEAAKMLADWALFNIEKFKTKKVLELGSGVGFTGITVAEFCQPKEFIFSDCHEDVLSAIDNNIAINFPNWQRENSSDSIIYRDTDQSLGVMKFDWFNFSDVASKLDPDVLIGADIIYDPTILQALCEVILHFFNRNKNLEVYIAGVIRNEETHNMFLREIGSSNLQHQLIHQADNIYIEWDTTVPKYLLKIRNKN